MVKYVDKNVWVEQVLMPDESTPILGGTPDWDENNMLAGWSNVPAGQLADRTRFLKEMVEGLEQEIETGSDNTLQKDNNLSDLQDGGQAKFNLGINLVDNTRDLNKPVSTPTQEALNAKVDKEAGKALSSNDFTTAEKNKLGGIEANAEVNQDAFSSIAVEGENVVDASSPTDTIEFIAGTGISITTDSDERTITFTNTITPEVVNVATKVEVLAATGTTSFVAPQTYGQVISWNDLGSVSTATTLDLSASLNHKLTVATSLTIDASGLTPGKTGDIVITTPAAVTVSWAAKWKFLGSVPNIGSTGQTWVVSYKVFDANTIYAAAVKVA